MMVICVVIKTNKEHFKFIKHLNLTKFHSIVAYSGTIEVVLKFSMSISLKLQNDSVRFKIERNINRSANRQIKTQLLHLDLVIKGAKNV